MLAGEVLPMKNWRSRPLPIPPMRPEPPWLVRLRQVVKSEDSLS